MRRGSRRAALALALALATTPTTHAGSSTATAPVVLFDTPGVKEVSLTVCNGSGCSAVTRPVTVLDPQPRATSVVVTPPAVAQGQTVLLAGTGAGKPPLSLLWRVTNAAAVTVATLPGPDAVWSTLGVPPGTYAIRLEVGNLLGIVASAPAPVIVLPPLFSDGFEGGGTAAWSASAP